MQDICVSRRAGAYGSKTHIVFLSGRISLNTEVFGCNGRIHKRVIDVGVDASIVTTLAEGVVRASRTFVLCEGAAFAPVVVKSMLT